MDTFLILFYQNNVEIVLTNLEVSTYYSDFPIKLVSRRNTTSNNRNNCISMRKIGKEFSDSEVISQAVVKGFNMAFDVAN